MLLDRLISRPKAHTVKRYAREIAEGAEQFISNDGKGLRPKDHDSIAKALQTLKVAIAQNDTGRMRGAAERVLKVWGQGLHRGNGYEGATELSERLHRWREALASAKSTLREYAETIGIAIGLALLIRTFVIQAFRIPSRSMEDTLLVGDFLLAEKITYGPKIPLLNVRLPGLRKPRPGDIIIFEYPKDPDRDFIKRCIAVEGQRVEIRDKVVYVDGTKVPAPSLSKHNDPYVVPKERGIRDNFGPVTVPAGMLFMMGDNRDDSSDSRFWGFLPQEKIKGRALILYWSWDQDDDSPVYTGPLSVPVILAYTVIHFPWKVRWGRIGGLIR